MKTTNIDWMPFIPDNWNVVRLKDIAKLQSGSGITSADIDEVGDFPVYGGNGLRGYTTSYTNEGDYVLIGRQGALCGNINYAHDKFYASEHAVVVYTHNKNENTTWLGETLRMANFNRLSASAAQPGLAVNVLNFQMIPYPPEEIRHKIGTYLDDKLAKIDYRIGVLEKEKDAYARLKKSVINQTVTRGLNPNVALKDSGIDWIGMIPEHWETKRFKDVFRKYTTGLTPESKVEENFSDDERFTWVTIGDMTSRVIFESAMSLSEKVVIEKQPVISPKGSLLFSFKLSIGKTAFAGKDLYTNEAIVSIPPTKYADLDYFYYTIPSVCFNNATENIYGAKMLNQKIIANMLMIYPPLSEQQAIADYLDEKCAKIDAATENISKQIDASKRLKKAIINEAISGKLFD